MHVFYIMIDVKGIFTPKGFIILHARLYCETCCEQLQAATVHVVNNILLWCLCGRALVV